MFTTGPDKFSAVWLSHSSISDFIKCPRSYYLKNVYKDPITKHKIMVANPNLSLGSAVHNVLETVSNTSLANRPRLNLHFLLDAEWRKFSGDKGGFKDTIQEETFKQRGHKMIDRVMTHWDPLLFETVSMGDDLPFYWISEADNIILCGKVDWLSKHPQGGIQIIDFKTGRYEESEDSLQLPIYALLVKKILNEDKMTVSYWYLDSADLPINMALPNLEEAEKSIHEIGLKIKQARQSNNMLCPRGEEGCFSCRDYEKIIKGEAKYLGLGEFNKDLYLVI
ncbi:PD-(D/E)XK nuclease family protein [candidate division WWE3 bacterium]|uniref:PD-(D/E)XK nuclease family protein n=1 Tax=candidate division WWE3 bacterium TaxID=2053526 RepID=A0A7X9DLB8_UNCKA|nr:PD-(D/E)XK nuclease family protein [candidate division WWE3 bacterium]